MQHQLWFDMFLIHARLNFYALRYERKFRYFTQCRNWHFYRYRIKWGRSFFKSVSPPMTLPTDNLGSRQYFGCNFNCTILDAFASFLVEWISLKISCSLRRKTIVALIFGNKKNHSSVKIQSCSLIFNTQRELLVIIPKVIRRKRQRKV